MDFIFSTQFVKTFLSSIGIISSNKGADSNHAALYLDLHREIFAATSDPIAPIRRGIFSKHKKRFKEYGKAVDFVLRQAQALQHLLSQLDSAPLSSLPTICDLIDKKTRKVVLEQEQKFAHIPQVKAWSPLYNEACIALALAQHHYRKCENIAFS